VVDFAGSFEQVFCGEVIFRMKGGIKYRQPLISYTETLLSQMRSKIFSAGIDVHAGDWEE
jgi:hypothetical protein